MSMIDLNNHLFGEVPTGNNLIEYPTMLDILDSVMFKVGLESNHLLSSFLAPVFVDGYMACTIGKGPNIVGLCPKGFTTLKRFRGQQHYYNICLSSYDRIVDEKDKIIANLHASEFEILLRSHPVIQFILSRTVNTSVGPIYFNIDFEGLAQHYGIPTKVFDFSNDLASSAFFAVTAYNKQTDLYTPYIPLESAPLDDLYGVLYYCDDVQYEDGLDFRPLGMHYFNRPGAQSEFAFDPKNERDLNKLPYIKKIFFRHDANASKVIFNSLAKGKMLFPEDSLCGKAQRIIEKKDVCSAAAFKLWCEKNSNVRTQDQAMKLLQENNIHVVDNPLVSFEHDEIDKDCKEWDAFGKDRFLEKVTIVPFFKPIDNTI